MKVAGFSFIKNAITFDYPVLESIKSILPLVDAYYIAVGKSEDATRDLIAGIGDPKIVIIDTVWDETIRAGGAVLSVETNKALSAIPAEYDWAFYLQGDECLHEKDYAAIRSSMEENLNNNQVDGLLFSYHHFYGNYNYVGAGKRWYRNEIRIIRNNNNIISWKDAQGFRFTDGTKLKVKKANADIYHFGWVKPPKTSQQKSIYFNHINNAEYTPTEEVLQSDFNYHNIDRLDLFKGTLPAVMADRVKRVDWHFEFDTTKSNLGNMKFKHRIAFFIERLTGYRIAEYKNYKLI